MSSRTKILAAISASKPASTPLPKPDLSTTIQFSDKVAAFCEVLRSIGGEVKELTINEAAALLQANRNTSGNIVNAVLVLGETDIVPDSLEAMEQVQQCYIQGDLGVAENGAIWVHDQVLPSRILPFITQELFILLDRSAIVANMHEAYAKIRIDQSGYGVFIAGPSKTADIEQSLVIGAHGPVALTVLLIG